MTSRRVLKEYVRNALLEDDTGYGGYDLSGMGDSPYGMAWGGPSLFKVFVQPFADVISTGRAGAEKLSTRVRTLAKTVFEAVATSVIPILSSDFKKIFDKETEQLNKIKEKYRAVFERTDEALSNSDIALAAFLINPAATAASTILKTAPEVALGIFETLAGDNETLRSFLKKLRASNKVARSQEKADSAGPMWYEGRLYEDAESSSNIVRALSNPKVVGMFNSTPVAREMKQDALSVVRRTTEELLARYKDVMKAHTIEDLVRLFPNVDHAKLQPLSKVPPEQKDGIERTVTEQVRAAAKKLYSTSIQQRLDQMAKLGLSEDHTLVAGYKKVLNIVKSS